MSNNSTNYNDYYYIPPDLRPLPPQHSQRIYMIGICGMGMGTLASMLKQSGREVIGSDSAIYPPMSEHLASQGITVLPGYDPANLERPIDLVVVGNVVRKDNPEAASTVQRGLPYVSMAEMLEREFISGRTSVVISGTHGKTTTSGLTAWALQQARMSPGFMVGGILRNFGSSHALPGGPESPFVCEGDEYDTAYFDKGPKFLHYRPEVLLLNNVEFDHADIYQNLDHVLWAFNTLLDRMDPAGTVVAGIDCPNVRRLVQDRKQRVISYATACDAQIRACSWKFDAGLTTIETAIEGQSVEPIATPLIGEHNVRNVLACYGACRRLGVDESVFRKAMLTFQGMARRSQVLLDGAVKLIDDFAHHPTAVATTLDGLRAAHPGRRLVAAFEPRSATSRSNRFQEQYTVALNRADIVFLAPLHQPERLLPEQRLDLEQIAEQLRLAGRNCSVGRSHEELSVAMLECIEPGDVVVLMSNGGFGGLPRKLAQALERK
ncbi:MAG: Mur ligase family protein [Candidatus Alcyoniella australis]|nr:Mur ligase family protein [Candidatus Alcyoniella australis]